MNIGFDYTSKLSFWFFQRYIEVLYQVLVRYVSFFPFLIVFGFFPNVIKVDHFSCRFGTDLFAYSSKLFPVMQYAPFKKRNFVRTPFFNDCGPSQRAFDESKKRYFLHWVLSLFGIVPIRLKLSRGVHH
jgi:hypothetical protein